MFKPNIRGISKRNLRLGGRGWADSSSDSLIKYRLPWRVSWVQQVVNNPELTPVLSRSGQVFLVKSDSVINTKVKSIPKSEPAAKSEPVVKSEPAAKSEPVVKSEPAAKLKPAAKSKSTRLLAGAVAAGTLFIGLFLWRPEQTKQPQIVATQAPKSTEQNCKESLLNPEKILINWLAGGTDQYSKFTELSREELGGVEARSVEISCGQELANFQLKLVKTQDTWQLKNYARLEN